MATAIVDALPASSMIAERPTLAGPGFINVKLSHGWISERIHSMLLQAKRTHPRLLLGTWCLLLTDRAPLPECPLYSSSWGPWGR